MAGDYENISPEQYQQYIDYLSSAFQASSGFEREKLSAQIKDAAAARDNAYKIARLQASTSRYGVDVQSRDEMAKLKENARQFDANHELDMQRFGLEQQKFGLDYASTYARYASTPDLYFQRADLVDAFGRAANGLPPSSYGSVQGAPPTPKTQSDFAVLAGYPNPNQGAGSNPVTSAPSGGGTTNTSQNGSTDNRAAAAAAMIKQMPPSAGDGYSNSDYAVLNAIKTLYEHPGDMAPGTLENLRPDQLDVFKAGGARLGYSPTDFIADYKRRQPGQGSAYGA